jgi:hypothetical protein
MQFTFALRWKGPLNECAKTVGGKTGKFLNFSLDEAEV